MEERPRIRLTSDGKQEVWDKIRRKWVVLTPEERVRQQFVWWMVEELGYPQWRIANEVTITYNGMKKRCDSVVYTRDGRVGMVIEYKRPEVELTQKVFDQAVIYCHSMGVKRFALTNGVKLIVANIAEKTYQFLNGMPRYEDL